MKNRRYVVLVLAFASNCFAQALQIRSGATVYIEPMGGYETYLAAALSKKNVPLILVTERDKAEYSITSNVVHKDLNSPSTSVVVNTTVNNGSQPSSPTADAMERGYEAGAAERRALGETSASISVVDVRTSKIVFAYAAGKMGTNQIQKTAEDCAKHLKEFIAKSEKPNR